MTKLNHALRVLAIAIALPAIFVIFSCNDTSSSTTAADTTSVSPTPDSMTDTIPSEDTSGGKGDQTVPPKKP